MSLKTIKLESFDFKKYTKANYNYMINELVTLIKKKDKKIN